MDKEQFNNIEIGDRVEITDISWATYGKSGVVDSIRVNEEDEVISFDLDDNHTITRAACESIEFSKELNGNKFKKGDKVKVLSDTEGVFKDGEILTISIIKPAATQTDGEWFLFEEGGENNGLWTREIELVQSKESIEAFGDESTWKTSSELAKTVVEELMPDDSKPSNPKDAIGVKKVPMSVVSGQVMQEVALGLFEGAVKYGRHNYREVGVRGSVYYDATMRHILQWWEGEDIDEDSGLSHVTKAIASLVVLRDSMLQENWNDDRPPKVNNLDFIRDGNQKVQEILDKYPEPKKPFTEVENE